MISIHQILEIRDKEFWSKYWEDDLDFLKDYPKFISNIANAMVELSAKRIFIVHEDRAIFLAGFLAALSLEITIILPNTNAPSALLALMQPGDVFLKDIIKNLECNLDGHLESNVDRNLVDNINCNKVQHPSKINRMTARIIFYTSGSTAKPKEIIKSLVQLEAEIETLERMWGSNNVNRTPRFFSTVSHTHIYGLLFSLLWPVSANYKISRRTLLDWKFILDQCSMDDYIISSPSLLERLPQDFNKVSINKIFSSGSELKFDHAKRCEAFFGVLPWEIYGSTETGGIAYRQQFQKEEAWKKFDCVTIKADEQRILSIQSPYILEANFQETGDRADLLNNASFHLLGRVDRIVKVEGNRVSLNNLEEILCSLITIESAKVIHLKSSNRDELGATVVLSEAGRQCLTLQGRLSVIKSIKDELKGRVDIISVPRRWRFFEKLPVNTEGKIVSDLLAEYFSQEIKSC